MFFGLEVKANQKGAKPITIDTTLKLSQAVLEPAKNIKKEPVTLLAEYNKKVFIIAVLDPNLSWQAPLDLFFEGGSQVKFFIRGAGTVHITGYENFDDIDNISLSMSSEDEPASSSDEVELPKIVKNVKSKSPKAKTNGLKTPSKKEDDDDDVAALNSQSDSDDDDFDVADLDGEEIDDEDDEDSDEEMSGESMDDDDESDDNEN